MPELPDLPVRPALGDVTDALERRGGAVLVAPPGTGKTTLVPLALAGLDRDDPRPGRVLVAEPRRVAARAAASRMSSLLGTPVGGAVGYAVRGDAKSSPETRVEVVTSGLLLRRLSSDPELSGVHTVILDECHERHLDADLLFTLLLDARDGLRPDLRLLATSATLEAARPAELLGSSEGPSPILTVEARTYGVEIHHLAPARGERTDATVIRAVRAARAHGSVLAFLPGVAEINRVASALRDDPGLDADVLTLHGRLPAAEQDAALREGPRARVVLATSIAESSLTVPGVRAVVDAGLARTPHTDHRRGMSGLVTRRVSQAVADQRAGRAGREAPGHVYRCWPEGETLVRAPEPEIRTADLTRLALDLAAWGTPTGEGLRWWDAPPHGPLAAGRDVLTALGALDSDGAVTDRGVAMAGIGLHPRLARALLDGSAEVGARAAAEIVAVLDDDTLAGPESDLGTALARLRSGDARGTGRWRGEIGRLRSAVRSDRGSVRRRAGTDDAALVTALAHPERLSRRRESGSGVYLMAGGTAVEVPAGPLRESEWLAVAVADRRPGQIHGQVRLAAVADQELAEHAGAALLSETTEVEWAGGDVRARRVRRLGALVLGERRVTDPAPDAVRAALLEGLRTEGTGLLHWTPGSRSLHARLDFLHRVLGDPWPAVDEESLRAGATDPAGWLAGPLATARRRADLARVEAGAALRSLVATHAGGLAGRIDELAPERIEVPTGSKVALDYSGDAPALPVRVQEVFGWTASPAVAGGRVPVVLHLLSPAGRPAAVTADLESFWDNAYPQVRAELRGRYPKHAWPDDPRAATPTRRTKRRSQE